MKNITYNEVKRLRRAEQRIIEGSYHGLKDKTGCIFGGWTVIDYAGKNKHNKKMWNIRCNICGLKRVEASYGLRVLAKCKYCKGNQRGEVGFNELFGNYQRMAKKIQREFSLTIDDFKKITSSPCHYCGCEPKSVFKTQTEYGWYTYNGIDRINNNIGYIIDNCVACCEIDNYGKHTTSYEDYIIHLNKMMKYRLSLENKIDRPY